MKNNQFPTTPSKSHRNGIILALTFWMVGVACGVAYLFKYEFTSPARVDANNHWPTGTHCRLAANKPTLVMFVHPRCPCSRASMNELATLMSHVQESVSSEVLFV